MRPAPKSRHCVSASSPYVMPNSTFVGEADIGIDPNDLEIISKATTDEGDVIVEWKAIEYVLTEFTVDEPYQFEKRGKIILRKKGDAELLT